MNNTVFQKTMEIVRKHRDIKLITTERRKNYLMSEANYHTTKFFTKKLLTIEMKQTQMYMNNPVYLGLSILELRKILMYEFWYDCVKQKKKAKLCYIDTDSFIVHIRTDDNYEDIAEDLEIRFDTSNYELDHCLTEKMKK